MNKHLYKQAIKTLGVFLLLIAFFFASAPIYVFALTNNPDGTQSSAYRDGISNSSRSSGTYESLATETLSCSAGKILANLVSSVISSILGGTLKDKIKGKTKNVSTDATDAPQTVGINSRGINNRLDQQTDQLYSTNDKLNLQIAADLGQTNSLGMITGVSWNAMAYCIVNSVITYIADETIRWANTGFNDNPAFIENTGNFFAGLADREAGTFISQLGRNASQGGIDLCSNLRPEIVIGLSNYYGRSNFRNTATCSLSSIVNNMENFTNGDFSDGGWAGWFSLTQNDQNNRIGATFLATDELYGRLSARNNTAKLELGLNKGFLNYKKCDKNSDGSTDERSCKTVTPGIVIQGALEKTLGMKKDRLVLAQKFDQVVEAIVDNLIKKGMQEILSPSK